jgi:CRISPR/Cas system CSM-associated protein Csm3 (group 7 of RAMP superfamily)
MFYKARRPDTGAEAECLPASSLKGVWRNAAERILRSFDPTLACDPFGTFDEKTGSAGAAGLADKLIKDKIPEPQRYRHQCPACQLFGSTAHAGLIRVADAWKRQGDAAAQTNVAIDRFTGGAGHGLLFTTKPLQPRAHFSTEVCLENFDLWHIGLLALVWRDMNEGWVRVGSGTRKGRGQVNVTVKQITVRYPRPIYEKKVQEQKGLCSARWLMGLAFPSADESPLLPDDRALPESSDWREKPWVTFVFKQERDEAKINELRRQSVEGALKSRLEKGRAGFDFVPQEVPHAAAP